MLSPPIKQPTNLFPFISALAPDNTAAAFLLTAPGKIYTCGMYNTCQRVPNFRQQIAQVTYLSTQQPRYQAQLE